MERISPHRIQSMHILVVDDDDMFRDMLVTTLMAIGYCNISSARDGEQAITILEDDSVDLVISDVMMPRLDGMQLLNFIRSNSKLLGVPIMLISAYGDNTRIVECIENGAVDFLTKPVNSAFLKARVKACLELKYLTDREKALNTDLEEETQIADQLLYGALPEPIVHRIKRGEKDISEHYDDVTVVYLDIVGFTQFIKELPPQDLMLLLNTVFLTIDGVCGEFRVHKVKTTGDAYIAIGGLAPYMADHERRSLNFARRAIQSMREASESLGRDVMLRVGMATGSAMAGVVGDRHLTFDVWGEAIRRARCLCEQSSPNEIIVCEGIEDRLRQAHDFIPRGACEVRGSGSIKVYQYDKGEESPLM